MTDQTNCSQCGSVLPAGGGPCVRCLLAAGVEAAEAKPLGPGFLDDLPMTGKGLLIADKYRVIETIGRGGMGVVYKAWQENLDRVVAVKIISAGAHAGAEEKARFLREAKTVGKLQHPGIVAVHDWGEDEGAPFFSMEYVPGRDLGVEVKDRGPLEPKRAAVLVKAVAEAVAYAHGQQVLHRDLKPQNLLLTAEGGVKITDFGLAKAMDLEASFTSTGQVLGTAGYMAPEQADGREAGPALDIYGLGAVLYHLLTGRAPFVGNVLGDVLEQVKRVEPVPVRRLNVSVPEDLETICLKCLEKDPHRRYPSAGAVVEELGRFLGGESILAKPLGAVGRAWKWAQRRPLVAGLGVGLALALLGGLAGVTWQWRRAQAEASRATQSERLEAQQRQEAESARAETQETLKLMLVEKARDYSNAGQRSLGLAWLAHDLRMDPGNRLIADRLLSAALNVGSVLSPLCSLRHEKPVHSAQFSPDGLRVVTTSLDRTARVWDARTAQPLTDPLPHEAVVWGAHFSPNGLLVVTWSPTAARVWDARTGQSVGEPMRHRLGVTSAQFSPDALRVVTASADATARVWDARTGLPLTTPLQHKTRVFSARFSPDGLRVVTASVDGTVFVWEARTGRLLAKPLGERDWGWGAGSSPDRLGSVTASVDDIVSVWEARTGQLLAKPLGDMDRVWGAECSPDGLRMVTVSNDETARVWDARTRWFVGKPLRHEGNVNSAEFSPDGLRVVTASADSTARVWDARTGQSLTEPLRHEAQVDSAQFSPDGLRVVTVSGTAALVWDTRIGPPLTEPMRHQFWGVFARFSPDGGRVVTVSGTAAQVWDAGSGQPLGEPMQNAGYVLSAEFSPDGLRVVTGATDKTVRVFDARTGKLLAKPLAHEEAVVGVEFSPDGLRMATASADHTVRVWDTQTWQALPGPLRHELPVVAGRFSADGLRLATVSRDETARVWDVRTGQPLGASVRHEASVEVSLARFGPDDPRYPTELSPDGLWVVTAWPDNTARVWDAGTGKRVAGPLPHEKDVVSVRFSPDGLWVVTASKDETARIWDVRTGRPLTDPLRHEGTVNSGEFSPDGLRVVTASADRTARVWDARTGQPLTDPVRHGGDVTSARFSPDGFRVLTVSDDKTARVWDVPRLQVEPPSWLADLAEVTAGLHIGGNGLAKPLPLAEQQAMLANLRTNAFVQSTNPGATCIRWMLTDLGSRTISPFSAVTVPEHLRRIAANDATALREGLSMCPTNALLLARLASCYASIDPERMSPELDDPDFLSRRALQFEPDNPEVLRLRGAVLSMLGRPAAAVEPLSQAIEMTAQRTNSGTLRLLLLARAAAHRATGRLGLATADTRRALGIPARDANVSAQLVDLSAYYNAAFDEPWMSRTYVGQNLASLPHGVAMLGGTKFDVRGVIQLASTEINKTEPGYPETAQGIAIAQKAARLHFLHALGWAESDGQTIARYVVHFEGGRTNALDVAYGRDTRSWHFFPERVAQETSGAQPVWTGPTEAFKADWPNKGVRLYKLSWTNPRPDVEITSIDLISTMTQSAPFVIAITAEP